MDKSKLNILLAWVLIGVVMAVMYASMSYIWTALEVAK